MTETLCPPTRTATPSSPPTNMAADFSPTGLRRSRLLTESQYIARRYGRVVFDRQDASWFLVEDFPISSGWNKTHVQILIDIPLGNPGYPSVAPQWFWTDRDLRTSDGRSVGHFFTSAGTSYADQEYLNKNWGHFCIHVRRWQPSRGANLLNGHSLLTYLDLIAMVFRDRRTLAGG